MLVSIIVESILTEIIGKIKKLVDDGKIKYIRELGIGIVPYFPLGHGFFGGKAVVKSVPSDRFLYFINGGFTRWLHPRKLCILLKSSSLLSTENDLLFPIIIIPSGVDYIDPFLILLANISLLAEFVNAYSMAYVMLAE
ncbi:hypothetical protein CUMW_083440 [Citrus unshiu]|nr:hypothetical protein CUMW_083440 [Citrus unshiu]